MPLNFEQKKAVVAEIAEVAGRALSAIAAEYHGLTVDKMTELRVRARESGVYLRVVKNTLARRAVEVRFRLHEGRHGRTIGPGFSQSDPGSAARVMKDFAKENKQLEVKLISIGGKLLPLSDIEVLAKMPTYEQSISMLMAVMKAPVEKLARTSTRCLENWSAQWRRFATQKKTA